MFLPLRDENPSHRFPSVTVGIIVLNAVWLLWLSQLPEMQHTAAVFQHGFVPARLQQLRHGKAIKVAVDQVGNGRGPFVPAPRQRLVVELEPRPAAIFASLLTAMFMHGGWIHLLTNMWFLWIFGNNIEDRLGHVVFAGFYCTGGILASMCHWAANPISEVPVVGASGAVAAVLGAYAVTYPTARIRTLVFLLIFITIIDLPALVVLGFWFVGQVIYAGSAMNAGVGGGVAWWAHVGGFVAGAILMPLLGSARPTANVAGHHGPESSHPRQKDGYRVW